MSFPIQRAFSRFIECVKFFHRMVKIIEPWGILIAVIALIVALIQFNTDRLVREAILIGLVSDRLEATRELQHSKAKGKVARLNTGQGRMLQIMASLDDGDLTDMDLGELYLRRTQLPHANLTGVDLSCSDLTNANLIEADLTGADLTSATLFKTKIAGTIFNSADLYGASLNRITSVSGVDFSDAKFGYTRLRNLDLRKAKGLTNKKVRNSCGYNVNFPSHITEELKRCSDQQRQKQKCYINESKLLKRLKRISGDVRTIRRNLEK